MANATSSSGAAIDRWVRTYRTVGRDGGSGAEFEGSIWLERIPAADGTFELDVCQLVRQGGQTAVAHEESAARIQCAADSLGTPRSWRLVTRFLGPDGKSEIPGTRVEKDVVVDGTKMRVRIGKATVIHELPKVFTGNWCLLEAVQRLAGPGLEPLAFDLLDELEKLKPGHQLSYRQKTTIRHGQGEVAVHCYQQLGSGYLPILYHVDENGLLLLVLSGRRGYALDLNGNTQTPRATKREVAPAGSDVE